MHEGHPRTLYDLTVGLGSSVLPPSSSETRFGPYRLPVFDCKVDKPSVPLFKGRTLTFLILAGLVRLPTQQVGRPVNLLPSGILCRLHATGPARWEAGFPIASPVFKQCARKSAFH